jgi:hypothetical protein
MIVLLFLASTIERKHSVLDFVGQCDSLYMISTFIHVPENDIISFS